MVVEQLSYWEGNPTRVENFYPVWGKYYEMIKENLPMMEKENLLCSKIIHGEHNKGYIIYSKKDDEEKEYLMLGKITNKDSIASNQILLIKDSNNNICSRLINFGHWFNKILYFHPVRTRNSLDKTLEINLIDEAVELELDHEHGKFAPLSSIKTRKLLRQWLG